MMHRWKLGGLTNDRGMTGTLVVQTEDEQQRRTRPPSFIDALAFLCHTEYKLVDAQGHSSDF